MLLGSHGEKLHSVLLICQLLFHTGAAGEMAWSGLLRSCLHLPATARGVCDPPVLPAKSLQLNDKGKGIAVSGGSPTCFPILSKVRAAAFPLP